MSSIRYNGFKSFRLHSAIDAVLLLSHHHKHSEKIFNRFAEFLRKISPFFKNLPIMGGDVRLMCARWQMFHCHKGKHKHWAFSKGKLL